MGGVVDGALEFLAVADATEILMKCAHFHDNRQDVISATCRALGSLVMNGVRSLYGDNSGRRTNQRTN